MTPKEIAIADFNGSSKEALQAELRVHGYEPSEFISKDILINMLVAVYFEND